MTPSTDLFGEAIPNFDTDAYGFLLTYAKRMRGQPFCSEEVTLAALESGLAPVDLRRWGSVFAQASREGFIRRSEKLFQRSMGNGTLAPGWVGV